MRHKLKRKKLNRDSSHRCAMLANMAISLIVHEQIKTTLAKAKVLRPYLERLVTKAKKNSIASVKDIKSRVRDITASKKLMSVLADRYKFRSGGYIRIVKAGFRPGDMAPVAYIEFVDRDVSAKGCINLKTNLVNQEKSIQE
jgi:large subunit ribosomal protein L17